MGGLVEDGYLNKIQGFAPRKIVAVSADTEWSPDNGDRAFCVSADCTYLINDTGLPGNLIDREIRVIYPGQTYTFNTSMNIEVM